MEEEGCGEGEGPEAVRSVVATTLVVVGGQLVTPGKFGPKGKPVSNDGVGGLCLF